MPNILGGYMENELFTMEFEKNSQENNKSDEPINKRFYLYNPDQFLMLNFNPEKTFPEDTFERFVVNTLKEMDLKEFETTTEKDFGGRNSYHPKSYLGLIYYGYSNGVFSSRRLSDLCSFDYRYMFVSGGATPHHSSISRFLNKYSSEIVKIFSKILYIAENLGYRDFKQEVVDGSKIKASAGKKFSGTLEDFKKREIRLEKKIKEAIEKQQKTDKDELKEYWNKKQERFEKEKEKIKNFLLSAEEIYTQNGKETRQNITDPDSRIMKMKEGGFKEGFNVQITASTQNGIITGCDINNNACDIPSFIEMYNNALNSTSEENKELVKKAIWTGDNGYYSVDNILFCKENDVDAYISDSQDKEIYKDEDIKEITLENGCIVKKENGVVNLFCQNKKALKLYKERKTNGDRSNVYRIEKKEECENCPMYKDCRGKSTGEKEFWVKKKILDNIETIHEMKNKIRTEEGRMIYSKRMPTIEKIFGYIKNAINFNRFLVRGLEKVKTVWAIICSVYNLKRIYNLNNR